MSRYITFAIAAGLNRGSVFLLIPILGFLVASSNLGKLSIFIISSQILVPLITCNVSSLISREVYEKYKTTVAFVSVINFILISILLFSLSLFILIREDFILIASLAAAEGIFLINSTYIRFTKVPNAYLACTLGKFLILFIALGFASFVEAIDIDNVHVIIFCIIVSNLCLSLYSIRFSYVLKNRISFIIRKYILSNKALVFFALALIPHILAQLAASGVDRYIIRYYLNNEILGVYVFSYSLAALFMLVNSSLALGLSQSCVKNFSAFTEKSFFLKLFIIVTFLWLCLVFFLHFVFPFEFTQYNKTEVLSNVRWVLLGLYNLSFYYYYSSVLFYTRDVKYLSLATIVVAIINIGLAALLVPYAGIIGASIATYIAYNLYFVIVALRCPKHIRKYAVYPIVFSFIALGVICLL
ncbi:MAG: polysaccharide biosynthesis C-terminal domain-containing protein [Emcibacter sp.]|nr:polysaccharide biosynthesis C-terminal domain-containing protein [Emcibacter sp.]